MALMDGSSAWMELNNVDVTAYITNISIDLKGRELIDVTNMGSTGHKWASNELMDVRITVDFLFDDTASTGSWAVLESKFDATGQCQFDVRPNGSGTQPEISGDGWIETLPIAVTIGDMIRVNGVVIRAHNAATVNP